MEPLALDLASAAAALSISLRQLQAHLRRGDLVAKYSGSKPLIPVAELVAFLDALPEEPRAL